MKVPFTLRFLVGFMAFVFVFGQLHEIAHLLIAWLICGCPGSQTDFNLWTLCNSCNSSPIAFVPTIAGPLFSYACMWLGFFWLRGSNNKLWLPAFVLVLGNLAFARIFTAVMGGGDETSVLRFLLTEHLNLWFIKILGFLIVMALSFPPLFMVYRRLQGEKLLVIITACVLPLLIMYVYEFKLLKMVLQKGFLTDAHLLGIPDFIYLHTLLMGMVVMWVRKDLFSATAKDVYLLKTY